MSHEIMLKPTLRFRFEHMQLLPDLHCYERRMEAGFTINGEDFIERTFVDPDWKMMARYPIAGSCSDPGVEKYIESGFVTTEGLELLKTAGVGPLPNGVVQRKLGVINPLAASTIGLYGMTEARRWRQPVLKDWRVDQLDPTRDIYRAVEVKDSYVWGVGGVFFVRLDGTPLPMALQVNLRPKTMERSRRTSTGWYGGYDAERLMAHLNAQESVGRVGISDISKDGLVIKVTWRPRDQAEFNKVWEAAEQKDPEDVGTKNLWDALMALDLMEIEQFRCDPKRVATKPKTIKSRLYRVTSDSGQDTLIFARSTTGALNIAMETGHIRNRDKAMVTDVSEQFADHPPTKAMFAGLVGVAAYHSGENDSGWQAVLNSKLVRINDKDEMTA